MYKTLKIAVVLLAGAVAVGTVAVVAMPILGRNLALDPTASLRQVVPTVYDAPADASAGQAGGSATSWQIASGSTVGYRLPTLGDSELSGHTSQLSGLIVRAGSELTDAEFMVDLATLVSDDSRQDDLLRTLVLAGGNTTATFVLTSPVQLSPASAGSADPQDIPAQTVPITGALSLRGVTNEVDAEVQVHFDESSGHMSGSIPVDLASYGIAVPSIGVVGFSGTAYIVVDIVATLSD